MKIEQLQQLLAVVEEGSMNEAAQKLYVARSSLSTSMKNLEAELGALIFERTTRGVMLTAFGRDVYHQAQDICQRFAYLQNAPKTSKAEHLSVSSMYCSLANDAFVEMFTRHYEDEFTCNLEECMLFDVIRKVSTGLTEIGVVTIFSDGEALALRKLEVINYAFPGDFSGERIWEGGARRNAEVLVSDLGSALQIVSRTGAVAIDTYDAETYRTFYAANDCKYLALKDAPIDCKLGWVMPKNHTLSQACGEFLEILREKAELTAR